MKVVRKYLALATVAVMLTACGSSDVITKTDFIDNPQLDPNLPPAMHLNDVHFGSIQDPASKDGSYLFTLTTTEYNNLSGNIVETQRYIKQLKQTVKYYKTRTPAVKK